MRGLEPPTPGTTIQCSNQLSYIHRQQAFNLAARQLADKGTRHDPPAITMWLPSWRDEWKLIVQWGG